LRRWQNLVVTLRHCFDPLLQLLHLPLHAGTGLKTVTSGGEWDGRETIVRELISGIIDRGQASQVFKIYVVRQLDYRTTNLARIIALEIQKLKYRHFL
jgi:hypothetical protein